MKEKKYETPGKRLVYGGGGIMPDVFVPLDTSSYQRSVSRLLVDGGFNSFVYNYYLQHKPQIDQYSTAADYANRFNNGEVMWQELVQTAARDSINLTSVSTREKDALRLRLKALLARYRWRTTGFYQVLNTDDLMVKKAIEIIGTS